MCGFVTNLHVFWIVPHVALMLWGQRPSQTASPPRWTRRRGFYWAARRPAQTQETRDLWSSWLLVKHNTHGAIALEMKYSDEISSTYSDCTFDASERSGAELGRVRGQAAQRRAFAQVVEAAGLRVVLRGAAHRLGPGGHGVGGWVHVALLLY